MKLLNFSSTNSTKSGFIILKMLASDRKKELDCKETAHVIMLDLEGYFKENDYPISSNLVNSPLHANDAHIKNAWF